MLVRAVKSMQSFVNMLRNRVHDSDAVESTSERTYCSTSTVPTDLQSLSHHLPLVESHRRHGIILFQTRGKTHHEYTSTCSSASDAAHHGTTATVYLRSEPESFFRAYHTQNCAIARSETLVAYNESNHTVEKVGVRTKSVERALRRVDTVAQEDWSLGWISAFPHTVRSRRRERDKILMYHDRVPCNSVRGG